MFNHVLANRPQGDATHLAAALAGIKQRSVDEFLKAYPNTTLDEVITSAKKAGYEVQVLS